MVMSVEFDDPIYTPRQKVSRARNSFLVRGVIDAGFAKDEKGAQVVLVVVFTVLVCVTIAIVTLTRPPEAMPILPRDIAPSR